VDPMSDTRSGIVTFAGVLALIIGIFNALAGIAAIAEDDEIKKQATEVLYGIDLTVWGWVWLGIGALQILTGYLILVRHPIGLMFGVAWAVVSATLTVFSIFTFPLYAILVLALEVLIIYALLENADEFA
jgi:hypothetical protein